MMKRIIVALSATVSEQGFVKISEAYLNAVRDAGGIPSVLSPKLDERYIQDVCESSDGFLFCGGEDIDPKYYGEEKRTQSKNACSIRDEFEERLFSAAYKTGKPILGICRGMQVINVFLGGSLHQHINGHVQTAARCVPTHAVTLEADGLLRKMLGQERIAVNSFHHQTIKKLAPSLFCDAISAKDGYVEAFHHISHPFLLGVQWHPECYFELSETSSRIFEEFIKACKK